eukprot:5105491-Amphidinium_carterae.1
MEAGRWRKNGTSQDIHLHRPGTGQDRSGFTSTSAWTKSIYIYRTAIITRFLKDLTRSGFSSTASALGDWGV